MGSGWRQDRQFPGADLGSAAADWPHRRASTTRPSNWAGTGFGSAPASAVHRLRQCTGFGSAPASAVHRVGGSTLAGQHRLGMFRALAANTPLLRVVSGYTLFILCEYSVWIAMLVYAYARGGALTAGVVALAQLVPAALLAPFFVVFADRRSPVVLLAVGYLMQAAAMGAAGVAIIAHVPMAAYAAAVVASTAVTTTRPAQSTMIPSLAVTPGQLTAANVIVGWAEAAGIAIAGSLTGSLIASVRLAVSEPRLRLMLALLTAEAAVLGALDLLFVILAVTVLGRPQAWAGYLNSAYGVGAILAAAVSVLL